MQIAVERFNYRQTSFVTATQRCGIKAPTRWTEQRQRYQTYYFIYLFINPHQDGTIKTSLKTGKTAVWNYYEGG